ncbi:MAG TPA: 50S ribosomal protein L21 [Thermoanaerobaculia bacterium]|jgi:large subunit ribosomal protein L21|nr:50S ribosomal protein L21 [Thermoanaerobaculia bacterium]
MFAIIESGGKQYRVERGDVIEVEIQPVSGKKVEKVTFDRVLMVHGEGGVRVGGPTIDGAAVSGVVVDKVRGPKLVVFKKKRRKGYRRTRGHRQHLLRVRIQDISL